MDDFTHSDLIILQSAELTDRTPFCPEDSEISDYFDGQLAEVRVHALEQHLADCRFCQARIGMLHRQHAEHVDLKVPEEALAKAKQMKPAKPARSVTHAPAWAAAAVIVIAMVMILSSNPVSVPEPGVNPGSVLPPLESERQLRNIDHSGTSLDILSPAPGATVTPGSLIRWNNVPGNAHYSIVLLSEAGDVLWKERLRGTKWALPDELNLPPGREIFFLVEAETPAGGKVSSKYLVLRAANRQ